MTDHDRIEPPQRDYRRRHIYGPVVDPERVRRARRHLVYGMLIIWALLTVIVIFALD